MWIILGWLIADWFIKNDERKHQQIMRQLQQRPVQQQPSFYIEERTVVQTTNLWVHTPGGEEAGYFSEIKIIDRRAGALGGA